jgi:hypothetical protein
MVRDICRDLILLHTNDKLCLVAFSVFIIMAAQGGTFSAYGASSSPSIFFKGSKPYGVSYEDWMIEWWQWNVQIPKGQHPVVKPDLIKCPVGESGNVTFLTHSLRGESQYSCTIPAGNAIMIPIGVGACTSDEARSSVPADLIKCATEGDKFLTYNAAVDGVNLLSLMQSPGFDQKHAISKIFNMTVPRDNFLDLKPGQWEAVASGYFAFLKPLPVGNHTVSISATVTNPIDPNYNFDYDTQYLLNAQ